MKTQIDQEKLKYWVRELSVCSRFLKNFFGTCEPFSARANYLNYISDIQMYSATNRHIKANQSELLKAFYEIVIDESIDAIVDAQDMFRR